MCILCEKLLFIASFSENCLPLYSEKCIYYIVVKKFLRCFVSVIFVTAAFVCCADGLDSAVSHISADDYASEVSCYYSDISTSDSDIYLPRRSSTTNTCRLQSITKRTHNAFKNNFEFIKAGKIICAVTGSSVLQESLNIRVSFIEPAQRLISLGKLII